MTYMVDDLQACEPEALTRVEGIAVERAPELDSMGFDRVAVYGPTREAVLEYVRENWGDDDADWFKEWVEDRIERVLSDAEIAIEDGGIVAALIQEEEQA